MSGGERTKAAIFESVTAELVETYASRAAVAQAARHLASMPAEKRERLEKEWHND